MSNAGRAQREPMERLVRLMSVLHQGGRVGVEASVLVDVAGFGDTKDPTSALGREFRHLRDLGWQIENVGGTGLDGRYRMTTVDNRLRLRLTPGQQAALLRAVVLADRQDLAERLGLGDVRAGGFETVAGAAPSAADTALGTSLGTSLGTVLAAVKMARLLRFRYKGTDRLVHPESVKTQNGTWYLGGHEEGDDRPKWFVVSRMSDVVADPPGSAAPLPPARHTGLHPMTWEIDPPVEVTLRAAADYVPDVRRWLGEPQSIDGDRLVYRVTNRAALRVRLYELGPRVELVGPPEVKQELLDELAFMAGE